MSNSAFFYLMELDLLIQRCIRTIEIRGSVYMENRDDLIRLRDVLYELGQRANYIRDHERLSEKVNEEGLRSLRSILMDLDTALVDLAASERFANPNLEMLAEKLESVNLSARAFTEDSGSVRWPQDPRQMDIEFETLVVGLFALLPGFVSSSIRSMLVATQQSTTASWTVGSIVASLFLNAIVALCFLLFRLVDIDLEASIQTIQAKLPDLAGRTVLYYLVLLYALAVGWGLLTGLLNQYAPRRLVFLARLSPVSPERNVFTQALAERFRTRGNLARRGSGRMQVPWLKINSETGVLFGRLQHSSLRIDADKAFEIFLSPVYRIEQDRAKPMSNCASLKFEGLYARVRPKQLIEVFSMDESWQPQVSCDADQVTGSS